MSPSSFCSPSSGRFSRYVLLDALLLQSAERPAETRLRWLTVMPRTRGVQRSI
jgi:hypothetical protein